MATEQEAKRESEEEAKLEEEDASNEELWTVEELSAFSKLVYFNHDPEPMFEVNTEKPDTRVIARREFQENDIVGFVHGQDCECPDRPRKYFVQLQSRAWIDCTAVVLGEAPGCPIGAAMFQALGTSARILENKTVRATCHIPVGKVIWLEYAVRYDPEIDDYDSDP